MVHFQRFGKYEIVRKLSRSMTDVYLARETDPNRMVVLKVIEHSRDNFTQLVIEAERRGAQIQKELHALDRRILQVYDFGDQNQCFFVSMQYFEGRTLAEILQTEHRVEAKRAARYAAEICSQLRSLHSFLSDVNGRRTAVVHGDIKPSNVQIGPNDELRLLDFGIAKVITFTHNLTHHNLGSPSYCSPERISKCQVDQHADLWATGVSLYELLAGTPPYQAQNTRKLENLIQSRRPPRALPLDCPAQARAIVAKALAPDLLQRYSSAQAFENDLRAFLENRPTVAEREKPAVWDANATVENSAPGSAPTVAVPAGATAVSKEQHATRKASRAPIKRWNDLSNVTIALLAGILAGLLIFIPIGYYYRFWTAAAGLRDSKDYAHQDLGVIKADWNLYQELKRRNNFLGRLSPVASLDGLMYANLTEAAENVFDTFRSSTDERLSDFDWSKARYCLQRALDINSSDRKVKAQLALSNGYLNLAQNPKAPKAALSIDGFRQAESYLPRSPDPHLALARVYVYSFHNIGQAVAEFHQAEQLGYKLGPKEIEEEADGYLFRAEWALAHAKHIAAVDKDGRAKWLQMAHEDMNHARALYQPIVGFSNVSANLDQLQQDGLEQSKLEAQAKLETADVKPAAPAHPRPQHRFLFFKRWHWPRG